MADAILDNSFISETLLCCAKSYYIIISIGLFCKVNRLLTTHFSKTEYPRILIMDAGTGV